MRLEIWTKGARASAYRQLIMQIENLGRTPSSVKDLKSNSTPPNAGESQGAYDLLSFGLKVLSQKSLQFLMVTMTFSLAVWSMFAPRWIRLAISAVFTGCSFLLIRFGFRE